MSRPLFEIRGLSKHFRVGRDRVLKAVDDVSFDIMEGEVLGVVGESGSGKSTLGRCVMGMVPATSGSVIYGGRDISALKPSGPELKKLRGEMQIVFQNPRSSFNPRLHLKQQLTSVAAFYGLGPQEARRRIAELFELTGLSDDILLHRSDELSGGQLQRLAIVRALIPSPSFLMADEAVSALDVSVRAQILELFRDMQERLGLTVFFVSHDLTVVEYIADRVLVLYLGSILESAPAEELFARPAHPYTKSLLAAKPRAYPDEEKRYEPLEGEIGDASDLPPGCRFCPRCRESIPGLCDKEPPPEAEPAPGHIVSCHLYAGQGAP